MTELVRYAVDGEFAHHALCHCADCRASSGAPAMAWMAYKSESFRITKGDVLHVPARSWHQVKVSEGESITYALINVFED